MTDRVLTPQEIQFLDQMLVGTERDELRPFLRSHERLRAERDSIKSEIRKFRTERDLLRAECNATRVLLWNPAHEDDHDPKTCEACAVDRARAATDAFDKEDKP